VALVEMFTTLKREFIPDLQVRDESEYWDNRDLASLTAKFGQLSDAIDVLADGLNRFRLNHEAAENPEAVIARVERVARLVRHTLARPAETTCWPNTGTDGAERSSHPLQQQSLDLTLRIDQLLKPQLGTVGIPHNALLHGAGEIAGGVAQAFGQRSLFSAKEDGAATLANSGFPPVLGMAFSQLKRAMRGAAFALAALSPLRADGTLSDSTFRELHDTIFKLQTDIFTELGRLRQQYCNDLAE
jgi:hypothetical protein